MLLLCILSAISILGMGLGIGFVVGLGIGFMDGVKYVDGLCE